VQQRTKTGAIFLKGVGIMKTTKVTLMLLAMVLVLAPAAVSLAKTASAQQAPNQTSQPAGIAVKQMKLTATVEAINRENREVTLKMADGSEEVVKIGPQAVNFDQVEVGDKLNTTYLESMVVSVQKTGGPRSMGKQTTVSLAPKGAMPKAVVTNTIDLRATVDAVDPQKHTVTVTGVQGKTRTMTVDPKVDLTGIKPGDEVALRYTEALVMEIEKPSKSTAADANTPAVK
jgi:Cu/Ag efflux protein CusF